MIAGLDVVRTEGAVHLEAVDVGAS